MINSMRFLLVLSALLYVQSLRAEDKQQDHEIRLLDPQQATYLDSKSLQQSISILKNELAKQDMEEYAPLCTEGRIKKAILLTIKDFDMRQDRSTSFYVSRLRSTVPGTPEYIHRASVLEQVQESKEEESQHYEKNVKPLLLELLAGNWPKRTFFIFKYDDRLASFFLDLQLDTRGGADPNMIGYSPVIGHPPYAVPCVAVNYGVAFKPHEWNYRPHVWEDKALAKKD